MITDRVLGGGRLTRSGLAVAVTVLLAAACGSSDPSGLAAGVGAAAEDAAGDETNTTTAAAAETTTEEAPDGDVAAWVEAVDSAMSDYRRVLDDGDGVSAAAALRAVADVVDDRPKGSAVEDDAAAFSEVLRTEADALDADADESAPNSPATRACFEFQEATAAAGLPLIDCAGSTADPEEPTVLTPGPDGAFELVDGEYRQYEQLEPGVYRLPEFPRPISIEFTEPVSVLLNGPNFAIRPVGDEGQLTFNIYAADELAAPGAAWGVTRETVPFPDDLSSYLEQVPMEIVDSGTTAIGTTGLEARYWTVPLPADPEDVRTLAFSVPQADFPLRDGGTLWQIDHPAGPLVVIALEKFEIPGAPPLDEVFAYAENIISTIEVIEGSVPPEVEDPDTADSNGDDLETLKAAMRGLDGVEAVGGSATFVNVNCEVPFAFLSPDFEIASMEAWTRPGLHVALFEFRAMGDRDEFFAGLEEVTPVCTQTGPASYEPELLASEAGHWLTVGNTVSFEGEGSRSMITHTRRVGETGLLRIDAQEVEIIDAVLDELGFG